MNAQVALQTALLSRFESMKIRYPNYSLRAFAKKAGTSPATMSLLMQGKRSVSVKLATQLTETLDFDPQERSEVLGRNLDKRLDRKSSEPYTQLSVDQYRVVSDWRAFAILSLIKTKNFQSNPSWIAKRLGISERESEETIERLLRLEMLSLEKGKLKRTKSKYRTSEDIANLSLKKSHSQNLELAQVALEELSVDVRDFTWLTLPMDLAKMSLAKDLIRKFQDDLSHALESDGEPTEVYRLAVQFFPLTQIQNDRKVTK